MGVDAVIVPRPLAVEALTVTGCQLRVTNTGPAEDEYSFAIDRESAQWGWVTPPTVVVPPGGERSVKVLFRLPKAPKPPAGPLPFTITVTSVNDKLVSTVAEGIVDVAPITDLVATLNPTAAQGSGPSHHTVALSNRGNTPVQARLTASDPDGNLDFDLEPVTLDAAPGTTASANLRVSPRRSMRRGTSERPFDVMARPEGREPLKVRGTFTQEGTGVGRTAVIVAVVIAVLAVAVAAIAMAGGDDSADSSAPGAQPIHYVVNPVDLPHSRVDDVRQAFGVGTITTASR